jgi:hypothetical protein
MKYLLFFAFFALLAVIGCEPLNRYLSWEDENLFEETGEFLFEKQTGMDLDFTPSTPEN